MTVSILVPAEQWVLHSPFLQRIAEYEAAVRAQRRKGGAAAVEMEQVSAVFLLDSMCLSPG